jgi:hypothetical protein
MNAQENPFAAERLGNLEFRFAPASSAGTVMARLESLNFIGAICGRPCSGKSLLLNLLAPHLEERGFEPVYFRLTTESGMREKERLAESLRHIVRPQLILIDGAEQLSTRLWLPVRAAAARAAGLIVTVNRISRLPMVYECETSASLLQDLAGELAGTPLDKGTAEVLFLRHRGNIRDCLAELAESWEAEK